MIAGRNVNILLIRLKIPDRRIIQIQFPVLLNGAPREHAVLIISLRRKQRDPQMLPMYQIFAHRMPPMHGPPHRRIRKILVKQMVSPLIIYKTVRIVHPIPRRSQMYNISPHKTQPLLLIIFIQDSR